MSYAVPAGSSLTLPSHPCDAQDDGTAAGRLVTAEADTTPVELARQPAEERPAVLVHLVVARAGRRQETDQERLGRQGFGRPESTPLDRLGRVVEPDACLDLRPVEDEVAEVVVGQDSEMPCHVVPPPGIFRRLGQGMRCQPLSERRDETSQFTS
ncbi:hypothetical protein HRbin27_01066 [bacterium HR27]|nr:hypothetical protein HRbin27_01066 [bacterium HR27]